MGPDRILAWQALPPTSPHPLQQEPGVPTPGYSRDPQALPALPLGPMPLNVSLSRYFKCAHQPSFGLGHRFSRKLLHRQLPFGDCVGGEGGFQL